MLLQHGFINSNLDAKPIKDLLLEYKAEVVEEVVDDEAEVSYKFSSHSLSPLSLLSAHLHL